MTRWTTILMLIGALVVATIVVSDGDDRHTVRARLDAATDVIPGIEVRSAGHKVGSVKSVDVSRQGKAEIELAIDDEIWPLPTGTRIRPRAGSSIAYSGRWIALDLPRTSRGMITEGGIVDAESAVEVDRLLAAFDARTRDDLRDTVRTTAANLQRSRRGLTGVIERTPPALAQVNALFRDLAASESDLHTLLRSTDRVVNTMVAADGAVDEILRGAAITFAATNDRAHRLEQLLVRTPPVLVQGRRTLARVDHTLKDVQRLSGRLAPGVTALRRTAPPLNRTLKTLTAVGPTARATLATARRASPDLVTTLDAVRSLTPDLKTLTAGAGRQLECIRPYSPEIAGMASTWTSFLAHGDSQDKYARTLVTALPFPNAMPVAPPALDSLVNVAFPRPPGQLAGQPWYLEECGVGEGVLSIANDPEINPAQRGTR